MLNPAKRKATLPSSASSCSPPENHISSRPFHGLPFSTIFRARAIRSSVGSKTTSLQRPLEPIHNPLSIFSSNSSFVSAAAMCAVRSERLRASFGFGARFSGSLSHAVITRCELMPPKPKALTPATRGYFSPSQSIAVCGSSRREPESALAGFSACSVGGIRR